MNRVFAVRVCRQARAGDVPCRAEWRTWLALGVTSRCWHYLMALTMFEARYAISRARRASPRFTSGFTQYALFDVSSRLLDATGRQRMPPDDTRHRRRRRPTSSTAQGRLRPAAGPRQRHVIAHLSDRDSRHCHVTMLRMLTVDFRAPIAVTPALKYDQILGEYGRANAERHYAFPSQATTYVTKTRHLPSRYPRISRISPTRPACFL